ncbi:SAM-dependent methyltransferase, partial [Halorubrum sp. SS5]
MTTVLSDLDRRKRDDRPDGTFYEEPRFVTHADDAFLDRLTALYDSVTEPGDRVLDAMGSWVSHLPETDYERVVGHGLNEAELAANDRLDEFVVSDLNAD